MMNIIKTAVITIAISFISGLLLDYYRNLAPRIVCNISKGAAIKLSNKKVYSYIVTISNVSKKTIHDINLNVHDARNDLKIGEVKITRGLKFNSSIKDNALDVSIPFLSKNDKLSIILYANNQEEIYKNLAIAIRSPENFKRIDSKGENKLFNIPKNIINMLKDKNVRNSNKRPEVNKKAIIIVSSLILVVVVGILSKFCINAVPSKIKDVKTEIQNSTTNETKPSKETINNLDKKEPTNNVNKETNTKELESQTIKSEDENKQDNGTSKNENTKTSGSEDNVTKDSSKKNTETTTKVDENSKNVDENKENVDENIKPKDETDKNDNTKTSESDVNKSTDEKTTKDTTKENVTKDATSEKTNN